MPSPSYVSCRLQSPKSIALLSQGFLGVLVLLPWRNTEAGVIGLPIDPHSLYVAALFRSHGIDKDERLLPSGTFR